MFAVIDIRLAVSKTEPNITGRVRKGAKGKFRTDGDSVRNSWYLVRVYVEFVNVYSLKSYVASFFATTNKMLNKI